MFTTTLEGDTVTTHPPRPTRIAMSAALACALVPMTAPAQTATDLAARQPLPAQFVWNTVANSADAIPGGDGRKFNSFNQPSVNAAGRVVLRARSRGGQGAGEPLRGIYARPMAGTPGPLVSVFDKLTECRRRTTPSIRDSSAPSPNFRHFRESAWRTTPCPRAHSRSRCRPTRPPTAPKPGSAPPASTRQTRGRADQRDDPTRRGTRLRVLRVPGATPATQFDQFPGAPAVADANTVAFKGNYTEGITSKTGIFFRSFSDTGVPAQTRDRQFRHDHSGAAGRRRAWL